MRKVAFFMLLMCLVCSCTKNEVEPNKEKVKIVLTRAGHEISSTSRNFAADALNRITIMDDGNIFFSPFSLQCAMAMAEVGAKGQTKEEIHEGLGFDKVTVNDVEEYYQTMIPSILSADNKTTLHMANSFWLNKGFKHKSSYEDAIKETFDAEVLSLKNGVKDVNTWVKKNTDGQIGSIVEDLNNVSCMLINALYFGSEWTDKFKKSDTYKATFHGVKGDKDVDFLFKSYTGRKAYEGENFSAMSLDFGNGSFAFCIVVPDEGCSLEQVLSNLDDADIDYIINGKKVYSPVTLSFPKFSAEYALKDELAKQILEDKGISLAFTPAADFSGITSQPLFITKVIQKAKIELDEDGVKAASATDVVLGYGSVEEPANKEMNIRADRPFAYFIAETSTRTVLFAGVQREF